MAHFNLKKGLNLPLSGVPQETLQDGAPLSHAALVGSDFCGLKVRLLVAAGDRVKRGQALLADKTHPEILYPSPGGGVVESINRGQRRALSSVVIKLDAQEEVFSFATCSETQIAALSAEEVKERLLKSGAWTALRRRPFAKIPSPNEIPAAIFVNAHDSQPLAPESGVILSRRGAFFNSGLSVLRRLFAGPIYVCSSPKWTQTLPPLPNLHHATFSGPHPAGNVGTHIHFLHPADKTRLVWYLDLHDLLSIGHLFVKGNWPVERVIALGGPGVKSPRLLLTRLGANLDELLVNELKSGPLRIISGSVLSGRTAAGAEGFLGRYHQQVTVLTENFKRSFLGWANPFPRRLFSLKRVVLGAWFPARPREMTTSRYGGLRAMVPTGSYEKVMPLDLMPTFLLRALLARDIDDAEALGCLELAEEDLALCSFVCPSKIEYGAVLREMLDLIEKEG
ncbi:MAG: Na(+)-translocating NADH-quinone reductase subunit A [Chrysiogenales bacterium]|nr:MAG: Na(+)-translocating NADH-quinone reductase subunit A [Chrysiogenales bacterium]